MSPAMMPTMTDRTTNRTPNTTEQHNVTVQQAARLLGITDEAVRARIRRGKLAGEKRGSTWVVYLSNEVGPETTQQDVTQHPTQPTEQAQQNATRDQDALVEHLQGEVAYLRERLEDAMGQLAEERRRADVLQLAASTGAHQDTPGSTESDDTGPRGLWVRLRRWLGG